MNNTISLKEIAHARSGDKGTGANVGVIAYTAAGYAFLEQELTPERLTEHLHELKPEGVQRYPLPGIRAFNFVLPGILDGGASRSLRIDSQGKVLALAVLEMQLPHPENLAEMQPESHQS